MLGQEGLESWYTLRDGLVFCRWREIGLRVRSWNTESNDICSSQVIRPTGSKTGFSTVRARWLLNHPCFALHTRERSRLPSDPALNFPFSCLALALVKVCWPKVSPIRFPPCRSLCVSTCKLLRLSGVPLGTDTCPRGSSCDSSSTESLQVSRDSPLYHPKWLPWHRAGQPLPPRLPRSRPGFSLARIVPSPEGQMGFILHSSCHRLRRAARHCLQPCLHSQSSGTQA